MSSRSADTTEQQAPAITRMNPATYRAPKKADTTLESQWVASNDVVLRDFRVLHDRGDEWSRDVKQEIEALAADHGDVDRAGDDAGTPGSASMAAATALVNDLPSDLPRPDVCATPKGEIDLTWFVSGGTVSLSIGPDGSDVVLTATLDDGREYSGYEPWRGDIPATMKCCLRDICIE